MYLDNLVNQLRQGKWQSLIDFLRSLPTPYATVARRGMTPRFHMSHHAGQQRAYSVRLARPFQSVVGQRLAAILFELNPDLLEEPVLVYVFLKIFCLTDADQLSPNCPAAADLFNLYAAALIDRSLGAWCRDHRIRMTRFRNHCLFSSQQPLGRRRRKVILDHIRTAGFTIDHRSRLHDLRRTPMGYYGVSLTASGRVAVTRRILHTAAGLLHRAYTRGDVPAPHREHYGHHSFISQPLWPCSEPTRRKNLRRLRRASTNFLPALRCGVVRFWLKLRKQTEGHGGYHHSWRGD